MKKKWNLLTALLLIAAMTAAMIPGAAAEEKNSGTTSGGSSSGQLTVDLEHDRGSIDVVLKHGSSVLSGVQITVYQVGLGRIEDNNLYYDLAEPLQPSAPSGGGKVETPVDLNGLTAAQNAQAALKLQEKLSKLDEKQIVDGSKVGQPENPENPSGPVVTFDPKTQVLAWAALTDQKGTAHFEDLPVGVYLVVQTTETRLYYTISSFLVYLPMSGQNGAGWDYRMEVDPKVEAWGSGGGGGGGESGGGGVTPIPPIDIPDPKPPIEPEPPIGPEQPVEPEVPVDVPDPETPATGLPQTGMLQWPIPLLAIAGLFLFSLGWMKEQKVRKADGKD